MLGPRWCSATLPRVEITPKESHAEGLVCTAFFLRPANRRNCARNLSSRIPHLLTQKDQFFCMIINSDTSYSRRREMLDGLCYGTVLSTILVRPLACRLSLPLVSLCLPINLLCKECFRSQADADFTF